MEPLELALARALGYPRLAEGLETEARLQSLVNWLENTKVRARPAEARGALAAADPAAWRAALRAYLEELGCPHAWDGSAAGAGRARALQWLLAHAAALEFEDRAAALAAGAAAAAAAAPPPEAGPPPPPPPLPDANAPEVVAALRALLADLHVDAGADGAPIAPAALALARSVVESQVLPAAAAAAAAAPGAPPPPPAVLLARLPLGFSTGDAALDGAAAALRVLYVRDLRRLQVRRSGGWPAVEVLRVEVLEYPGSVSLSAALL
jgi:RLL motif-containing protein 1